MSEKSKQEIVVDIAKLIIAVIGGCWIAYQYFSHERKFKLIEYQKSVIDTIRLQQEIVKNKQDLIFSKREDSIRSIELKYLNTIKQAELQALKLANLNNNIEYNYKEIESKLSIKSNEIDNQLNEVKLQATLIEKYKADFSVKIERKGFELNDSMVYIIKPKLEIVNQSVNDMEISAVVFEFYANNLSHIHLEEGISNSFTLEMPDNIFLKAKQRFMLMALENAKLSVPIADWEYIGYDCNVLEEAVSYLKYDDNSIMNDYLGRHLHTNNGLGTGIYKPEERVSIGPVYYFKMNTSQILGLSVNVLFNKGLKGRRFYSDYYVQVLDDVK